MSINIELNNYYIVSREENGHMKHQHVKIDSITAGAEGQTLYGYYYGVFGYHEGYCSSEKVREMNSTEKASHDAGKFWELPQSFYQSFPE
jgi:hypothetical protein